MGNDTDAVSYILGTLQCAMADSTTSFYTLYRMAISLRIRVASCATHEGQGIHNSYIFSIIRHICHLQVSHHLSDGIISIHVYHD